MPENLIWSTAAAVHNSFVWRDHNRSCMLYPECLVGCIAIAPLFALLSQNEGRKINHMEVASEKRRAQDPVGE